MNDRKFNMAVSNYIHNPANMCLRVSDILSKVVPKQNCGRFNKITYLRIFIAILVFCIGFLYIKWYGDSVHYNEDLVRSTNGVFQEIHNIYVELALIKHDVDLLNDKQDQFKDEFYKEKENCENSVEEKILSALRQFDADKTGLTDYALESSGGRIISLPNTNSYTKTWLLPLFGLMGAGNFNPPETILRPGVQPGECYSFAGNDGRFRIRLAVPIQISAVTIEHASFDIVADLRSAPSDFALFGLVSPDDNSGILMGTFNFDLHHSIAIQTFHIPKELRQDEVFHQFVELHIKSNHGHPNYTCLYRVRVHGVD